MTIYVLVLNYPDDIYVSAHRTHEGAEGAAMNEIDEFIYEGRWPDFVDPGREKPGDRIEAWNAYQGTYVNDPYLLYIEEAPLAD